MLYFGAPGSCRIFEIPTHTYIFEDIFSKEQEKSDFQDVNKILPQKKRGVYFLLVQSA